MANVGTSKKANHVKSETSAAGHVGVGSTGGVGASGGKTKKKIEDRYMKMHANIQESFANLLGTHLSDIAGGLCCYYSVIVDAVFAFFSSRDR